MHLVITSKTGKWLHAMRRMKAALLLGVHAASGIGLTTNGTYVEARPILLIHIPKTGGTSLKLTLGLAQRGSIETPECAGVPVTVTQHSTHDVASDAKSYYTDAEWEHAYKIAFVRNPWAKHVSMWAMQGKRLPEPRALSGLLFAALLQCCCCHAAGRFDGTTS